MSPDAQLLLQFVVGLTFLSSGLGKVLAPALFFDGLRDYHLLPPWAVEPAGAVLIVIEGLIAFSFLSGWLLQPVGTAALVLLGVFVLVISLAVKRGMHIRCLCFGASDTELVSLRTVARVILLAAVVLALLLQSSDLDAWIGAVYSVSQVISALTSAVLIQILTSWALAIPEFVRLIKGCRGCARRTVES